VRRASQVLLFALFCSRSCSRLVSLHQFSTRSGFVLHLICSQTCFVSLVMKSSSPFNLLRQFLLHRHLPFTLASPQHRAWCTAATPTTNPYHLWKEKEEEILRDIEPVVTLTKDILHSRSQMCLNEG
ncbi:hypothetical protein S245_066884, partial [Arachis hypogaea]